MSVLVIGEQFSEIRHLSEPLHDRDDRPCSIDVTDFNETLPVCSPKWARKTPKILASQTAPLLRYSIYNTGTLTSKMTMTNGVLINCVFHYSSTVRVLVLKFCRYILPYILYILAHSKSVLVVFSGIATFHGS
jgi:hypothetical protein